jgi:ATP-dependent Clp protease ATP-binding subunit ClpA
MFERFTNQARRVVVLAQDESRELNHNYIGTEHLVLGLLREEEGAGARALKSVDITLGAARREVETRTGRGHQQQAGHIPFTPRAKKSLELALRESLALGQDYIGTGHLLLGLLRKGDGVGVEVLVSLGADLNVVRERVIELLQEDNEQGAAPSRPERSATPRAERYPGQLHALLDAIDTRLSMIERHLGITRHVPAELRAFDKRIARVVGAKEEAIEREDFEEAAALREQEKQLRSERERLERELEKSSQGEGAEAARGSQTEAAGADLGAEPATGEGTAAAAGSAEGRLTDEGTETAEGSGEGPTAGQSGAGQVTGWADEVTGLRAEVARLTALLREHGIDLEKPEDPPAVAG